MSDPQASNILTDDLVKGILSAPLTPAEAGKAGADSHEQERRGEKRVRARFNFSLVTKNAEGKDAKLCGHTDDISLSGCSILTAVALRLRAVVAIRVELYHDGRVDPIVATGKIIYQTLHPKSGGFRYGVQFVKMGADYRNTLERFLAATK